MCDCDDVLLDDLGRLRKALEFYADPKNRDRGEIARKALDRTEPLQTRKELERECARWIKTMRKMTQVARERRAIEQRGG